MSVEFAPQKPKGSPRLSRKRAMTMVSAILAEAQAINADPAMLYEVSRLTVFGSYLGDQLMLGDLDIAFELRLKTLPIGWPAAHAAFLIAYPPPPSADWFARSCWPDTYVTRRLRVGRNISLHPHTDLDQCGFDHRPLMVDGRPIDGTEAMANSGHSSAVL
jgi:hypothetical protein